MIQPDITDTLVIVTWFDSVADSSGWKTITDFSTIPPTVNSVGWLIRNEDDYVVVMPHRIRDQSGGAVPDQGCGEMVIPRSSVFTIRYLEIKGYAYERDLRADIDAARKRDKGDNQMSERNCETCKHFFKIPEQEQGDCRRYPPTVTKVNPVGIVMRQSWPEVHPEDWCGEWAERKVEE